MASNPYKNLPASAFWKTGVAEESPYSIQNIYKKKFDLSGDSRIATAGSCFAQHISRKLKSNGYNVLDVEPPPPGLTNNLHQRHGFSMYSARYGNIYTVRQLLQLAQEVAGKRAPEDYVWEKNGKFFDALRPAVEPEGLDSAAEVVAHRHHHILRVTQLFKTLDVLIFTFGLTEMWVHRKSGTVYPTAPGTIAGEFDSDLHDYQNATFANIIEDFIEFQELLVSMRANRPFKTILTVSPVPLTATADGKHVLVSTTYSKAVLRSVAGELSTRYSYIDYFPSYEIVTNPRLHATSFTENLRSVRKETVDIVMQHFVQEHPAIIPASIEERSSSLHFTNHDDEAIKCEEALLEAFGS